MATAPSGAFQQLAQRFHPPLLDATLARTPDRGGDGKLRRAPLNAARRHWRALAAGLPNLPDVRRQSQSRLAVQVAQKRRRTLAIPVGGHAAEQSPCPSLWNQAPHAPKGPPKSYADRATESLQLAPTAPATGGIYR